MASILGRALSTEGLRALPFIESGIARQLSLNQIQHTLNRAGLNTTLTETDFIVRAMLEQRLVGAFVRDQAEEFVLDYSRLPAALTSTLREFSFEVQLSGINPFTGEPRVSFVTVSTDRFLSLQELEQAALSFNQPGNEEGSGGGIVQARATIISGKRRVLQN